MITNSKMLNKLFKRIVYLTLIYTIMLASYIVIQEFYIEHCTIRGGIMNLFVSMPMCTYANRILEMIGSQFITLFVSIVGLVLAITV